MDSGRIKNHTFPNCGDIHGLWLVSIVLLVENTTKLYPGPTIQYRLSIHNADDGEDNNDNRVGDDDDDGDDDIGGDGGDD